MKKPEQSSLVPWLFTAVVFIVVVVALMCDWIGPGTLIVLSLTLVAVIWYTYFTYRLTVKREKPVVVATIHYIPEARDVRVLTHNPTNRYAKTRVWVQAKVYGQKTTLSPDYSGQTIWHLTPQFGINGHFSIEKPLQQVGKDFDTMVAEASEENLTRQLRLSLKVEWEDEDGSVERSVEHLWYFDFKRNGFVYQVGGFPDD
jgi:hypothetical protein